MLQTVDMVIREVHAGLWFLVVGYYFFIFIFLLFFRYRKSGNPFQLAMALFFLLLAVGRCFYFVGDFYADPRSVSSFISPYNVPLLGDSPFWLMAGAFFQWMALAVLSATAGFMIFGKRWVEILFAVPAVGIGVLLGFVALDSMVRLLLAAVAGGIYALFIPLLFWYLAWQSGGNLRRSNLLLGLGFFILFAGRVVHSVRYDLATYVFGSVTVPGILAPGLIVIGLILIATGSEWGQSS
ncbi:MAG: hypothetical protein ACTSV3_03330 [Candidatus Thorarchaeota archaeon]|nr:MAG: hypothetical protein DRP09_01935 [Candidatus Thorarchaeota archaeon]RLI59558.1 MAG: hypothetical protein DRO87_02555 [Candidatus Thorarchaeota archaeon]